MTIHARFFNFVRVRLDVNSRDLQTSGDATKSSAPFLADPKAKASSCSQGATGSEAVVLGERRATLDFPRPTPPNSTALKLANMTPPPHWLVPSAREPRTGRAKALAGLRGLKLALRRDSSFFAHAYRGVLVILAAMTLGVDVRGWCLLFAAGGMVLVAELALTAIAVLGRSVEGVHPEGLRASQEIAQGMALVATLVAFGVAGAVLLERFGQLQGWWAEPASTTTHQSQSPRNEGDGSFALQTRLTQL
jgi:diacylglycerol kinase (ATP)